MKKDLSVILVIDIESTCWERDETDKHKQSEIIEVGVTPLVNVNSVWEPYVPYSYFVKDIKSDVSRYCTELTGITLDHLTRVGIPFRNVCQAITRTYNSSNVTWSSWGDYDREMFKRNCAMRNCDYPFSNSHINVKNLFSLMRKLPREPGLNDALKKLNIEFEGIKHSGKDDSYNVARVLAYILNNGGK